MCDKKTERVDKRMERDVNQIIWVNVMGALGVTTDNVFENDTFIVRSYDWGWEDELHNNDWHFWHKPSGFKMAWYKYPLRSPMSNMDVTHEEFLHILRDCHNSMQTKSPKLLYNCNRWWEDERKEEIREEV